MEKKLTEEMKSEIIEKRKNGAKMGDLAEEYGVSRSCINNALNNDAIYTRNRPKNTVKGGKSCPKCHRGPFPAEFTFCPYCAADIRSDRDKLIELLEKAEAGMHRPFDDASSRANYSIQKAIAYLKEECK